VLDDAPTPLLTIGSDGRIELANKAARRLFIRHQGVRIDDYRVYGETFANTLAEDGVGRPRLVPLMIDAVPQTAMVSAASVHRPRRNGACDCGAAHPGRAERGRDRGAVRLVRVLTHEIMNSMTPVTSLARTAADLMKEVDDGAHPDIADARAAVETLARRADGVMHFVESYRQISRTPVVRRRVFEVAPWARELKSLFKASDSCAGVALACSVTPETLTIDVDPDLMSQVLINLLRNAAEAAAGHAEAPAVSLSFSLIPGGRVQIEVADNGPRRAGGPSPGRLPALFHHQAKGTGRRPKPRAASGARPSRLDRTWRARRRRRPVPDYRLAASSSSASASVGTGSARLRPSKIRAVSSRTISMTRWRRHLSSVMQFLHFS
jgi:signal transduction histidine kinase